jgi:hypothetical protein
MGEWMYSPTFSWPWHYLEVSGQLHARVLYSWGKSPWYPLDRRLGGPHSWSGWHREVKILTPIGTWNSDSLVVQPVASRYTNCAIPALINELVRIINIHVSITFVPVFIESFFSISIELLKGYEVKDVERSVAYFKILLGQNTSAGHEIKIWIWDFPNKSRNANKYILIFRAINFF